MKALNTIAPYKLKFEERPRPSAGSGLAVVRTKAVAICGSDIGFYQGTHPVRTYPMIHGHEACGIVESIGDDVTSLKRGDFVSLEPLIPCGVCYSCRIGRSNCCSNMKTIGATVDGALADFFCAPADCLHVIPEDIDDPAIGALAEPFSIGFHAVDRGGLKKEDRMLLFGAGPIGLTVLIAAKKIGAEVAITDLFDNRLNIAKQLGADLVINARREDVDETVREWTDNDGASVVAEAVGIPATFEKSIELASYAGRVVIIGVMEDAFKIPGRAITGKELSIFGSRNNIDNFKDALDFLSQNQSIPEKLISHRFKFENTVQAFEFAAQHPEKTCKVIIEF
jgi:threonine dehydrogenase-like Zn-dependent dehydrogenase